MSKTKKILAALLAALMLFTVLPVTVFAGFEPMFIEEADKYGKITWKVEGAVLKISGEGDMLDFCINGEDGNPLQGIETSAPWRDYRDTVTTVVIEDGITSIGWFAFNAFSKLTEVFLPVSIKEIRENAFDKCDALKKVYYDFSKSSNFSFTTYSGNDSFGNAEDVWGVSYASAISYTVKFNANGGTGTMKEISYERNKSYNLPANAFKKSCYSFAGWNTKKDGSGTTYKNKASVSNLAKAGKSITLYATWKIKSDCYTVTYKLNGGKNNSKNPETYSSTGKDKTLKNPSKSGYTFDGWYKNSKFTGSKVTKISVSAKKNITLYAKWVKAYKVKFYANGGTGEMKNANLAVGVAEKLPSNKFKRDCYTFAGWNTKKDGSGKNYKNKASVKNLSKKNGATVKLYAKWKLNKNCYTIKYTLNGGKNNSKNPEAYSASGKSITLKNPKKTGYTFKGWYNKSDFSGDKVTKITVSKKKNVKLYAKWAVNKYTVKFSANGGKGSMKPKKCTYGKSYKLPANTFKKDDYVFAGWNTKKDGTGTTYGNKAALKNLSSKKDATVTLYAQWNRNVTDAEDLEKVLAILPRTCEPLYQKLQGQSVSYKHDSDGRAIWSVSTRMNGTWEFITAYEPNSWNSLGSTYCSAYSTPYLTMDSQRDGASGYRDALVAGTYDYKNDPGNVLIAWSMFSSSTAKADFQKMINNKISDEVFNQVIAKYNARTNSVYGASCVIVYGKDSDGKLIGKYAGSVYYNNASNATLCYFVGINPKNTADYGKTVSKTVFY